MGKLPLRLFLLGHPRSDSAGLLAQELMRRFVDMPATGGLRVPVFLTPDDGGNGVPPSWEGGDGIELDSSEHTLVVVLADAQMARRVDGGTGEEWKRFLKEGAERAPVGESPHHVFGVAIAKGSGTGDPDDPSVLELGDSRHMLGMAKSPSFRNTGESLTDYEKRIALWLQNAADEIALQVAIRAIALLDAGAVTAMETAVQKAPVRIFLSHAKADLKSDESDAVRAVMNALKEKPVDDWFDAAQIPPGAEFETKLKEGVADSTILVAFLTNRYASRPWCQREVLFAKELGVPILVVDALTEGEPRNFPYLGNVPTLHWPGVTELPEADREPARRKAAERVLGRAVREVLRFKHNRATLGKAAIGGEIVLASAPEVLAFAWHKPPADAPQIFFYPDPPLARSELDVLQELRPHASFTTPLSKVARAPRLNGKAQIAVSTSGSNDKERFGFSRLHEDSIFDEIHGYLLLAGLQIGYGGALMVDFTSGSNFTTRLFELVRSYRPVAANAGGLPLKAIVNFVPWPLHPTYGERELQLFGSLAELVRCNRPAQTELFEADSDLFPAGKSPFLVDDSPLRRFAWTRGLTTMRWQITRETDARLVIGGTLAGFKGLYPGVLEEAWMSIVSKKPVFIAGAFGGASRVVIDLLEGRYRFEVANASLAQTVPHFETVLKIAQDRGLSLVQAKRAFGVEHFAIDHSMPSPDKIVEDLNLAGQSGLAAALNNGLSDGENSELARTSDGSRIAELVLTGLGRLA